MVPSVADPGDVVADYARFESALAAVEPPFAVVDLDAMWSNAAGMLRRAGMLPIRVATKSVRSRNVLRRIVEHDPRFRGLMTFTLAETLWLCRQGFGDLLLAYPTTDRGGLEELARLQMERPPAVMVDSVEHLDLISSAARGGGRVRVCIDVDVGYHRAGGRISFGPKRSPVRTAAGAAALADEIVRRPELELAGIMGYEGHVAGVGDRPRGRPLRALTLRSLRRLWIAETRERRAAVVAAVSKVAHLEIVNGGGTGSLQTTSSETVITEVTAGSGFYAPALFDEYSAFRLRPAAMFALAVVRKPSSGVATALGGGYIASGAPGQDRLPVPHLPGGLRLDALEGAGEVQTPLCGPAAERLRVGDRVYLRHAKAGELCEHFDELHLLSGDTIVDVVPTYRGEGRCFL
jgi:D-serine deaminase-like pyridoxal phosphate-dependent protein